MSEAALNGHVSKRQGKEGTSTRRMRGDNGHASTTDTEEIANGSRSKTSCAVVDT